MLRHLGISAEYSCVEWWHGAGLSAEHQSYTSALPSAMSFREGVSSYGDVYLGIEGNRGA